MKGGTMNYKKVALPLLGLGAIAVVGVSSVSLVNAQGGPNGDRHQQMIQELSQRFNLNQQEVESFFEEKQEERQAEMQSLFEERLSQAVADGKITEEQRQEILEKHQEIREQRQAFRDLEPEERRQKMQEVHQEMQQWMESNGIEPGILMGNGPRQGAGERMKQGMGRRGSFEGK